MPLKWKIRRSGKCLYGKLFNKKAGFVSREWIPDFANFRRDGYDFDARWDDGLASYKDKELYEAIVCRLWQNEVTTHHSERRQQTMSKKIVQLNEEIIKGQLKELVRESVAGWRTSPRRCGGARSRPQPSAS